MVEINGEYQNKVSIRNTWTLVFRVSEAEPPEGPYRDVVFIREACTIFKLLSKDTHKKINDCSLQPENHHIAYSLDVDRLRSTLKPGYYRIAFTLVGGLMTRVKYDMEIELE